MKLRMMLATAVSAAALTLSSAGAKEGMWTPDQMSELAAELAAMGLELDANDLADLTGFPMGAVISLGGCSASFVSPEGLVVTNHHCARGSIQYNSTEENNYLELGFLAANFDAELPAAPGSRVYVTVSVEDVTESVNGGLDELGLSPRDRYQAIEDREKALVAACEADPGHRCQVSSFHGGAQYKLIKRMEIRDVRLVYAPGDSVGKYGGDIDNWMWPRHTGDFAFYRAYVGPDGAPADYSEDNVPYQPEHFLKVSSAGLSDGDFVMAAGYPGSTSRYRRLSEVEQTFSWSYPTWVDLIEDWIDVIETTAPEGSDARIKYESRLAGLNNFMKNTVGQLEGAQRVDLAGRRAAREANLDAWIAADESRSDYADAIVRLDDVIAESNAASKSDFWYNNATRPVLLGTAQRLYRLSLERQKPDAQREPGYQERDMTFFKQGMERIDRRFDPAVDKAEWELFLDRYAAQPAEARKAELDAALPVIGMDAASRSAYLQSFYENTELDNVERRLELMDAEPSVFENSDDPFIQLAVALYDMEMRMEEDSKTRAGELQVLRPAYMDAIIAWQADQGQPVYPDANSTLRITYGTVMGGSPKDGLVYLPFTTLEGITEKDTGMDPFNAPERQLSLIEAGDYGPYYDEEVGSVPVNFLSDLDSTGGNSGSATLNAKGELVGLLFDGTIESVNSDWDFDPKTTRTIHVDTRYMLWIMDKVDGADRLIEEMTIVGE